MDNGGDRKQTKKDNIPESPKRKPNKVLGSAIKTIFTGKPPSGNQGSPSNNGARVAPE